MHSSNEYFHISQMEVDQQQQQQLAMQQQQQQQPRYNGGGGGARGGNYPRQGQGQGNLPRQQHPHQNQQQQQGQQGQGQGVGQGQAIRTHVPQQLQQISQYMFPAGQPVPIYYQNPNQQPAPYRYQVQYGQFANAPAYPIQHQYVYNQQQQQQLAAAAFAQAAAVAQGSYYYQAPAQSQNPQHPQHPPQPYYVAPQTPTVHPQYVRAAVPTALSVAAPVQQQPPQTQQPQHLTHSQVQVHQVPQQVPPGSVITQQPIQQGLVSQGSLPQQQTEHRDIPFTAPPRRERKVLKITNPDTGEEVIPTRRDDYDRAPSASPQPTVESVGIPEENIRGGSGGHGHVVESFEEVPQHLRHGGHVQAHGPPHGGGVGGGLELPMDDQPSSTEDLEKNRAKADFFQRITAAADDSSRSNSTPDAGGTGVPVSRISPPLASISPTPPVGVVNSSSAFEPLVAASAPAFVHSPIISIPPEVPLEQLTAGTVPVGVKPSLPTQIPEDLPQPPSTPELIEAEPQVPLIPETPEPDPVKDESESQMSPPVMTTEEETESSESPATPPRTDGGRGDQFLDISTVSISPEPIEKYIELTPEKVPILLSQFRTESGEPVASLIGIPTTESSSSSPTFPPKGDNQSTPNEVTQESKSTEDEEIDRIGKGIEEIKITSVEPAQNETTFTNGGNEIHEGSGEEEEDMMEEGELLDVTEGESDEANEPIRKRIVYDRDTLINFKSSASKDLVQGIDSIPPELIRDERSSHNVGSLPQRPPSGGFPGQGGGGGGGYVNRNAASGGGRTGNNNRPFPNRPGEGGQWGMGGVGPGGMFAIPPPPPGHRRPPPMVIDTGYNSTGGRAKLHKAKDAWKPGKTNDESKDEEERLIDEMKKKTRGILNKLTPENFDTLVQKFLTLKFEEEIKDPENRSEGDREEGMKVTGQRIGAVIEVVFEKAIDEPSFSAAYARMVYRVYEKATSVTSKIFRKKILDQCQKEFQQGSTDEETLKLLEEKLAESPEDKKAHIQLEIEDKKTTARRRSLGNVRFIGELYILGMLTPKIMDECIKMLINTGEEESLECLCKLLTTIGQKLEAQLNEISSSAKKNTPQPGKWNPDPKYMDNTFNKLKSLCDDKSLSSRIRFALLDVYELRTKLGWTPRRDTNAPKTIDEVRRAADREEQEEKNKIMNLPLGPPPSRGGPIIGGGGPKKGEWNTVPSSNKSSRFSAQPKKSTGDGGNSGEMPKFAPGGGWGRPGGAGGGYHTQIQPNMPPRLQQGNNRFNNLPNDAPPMTPSREEIVRELPPPRTPTSQTSSRESSRPQTPTRERENNSGYQQRGSQPPMPKPQTKSPPPEEPVKEFDIGDSVKQIFKEFASVKKLDIGWVQQRYPGTKIFIFIVELSRQVCEMAKEEEQKTAGGLIRNLIRQELVTKAQVIDSLKDGVMADLPDIEVDSPLVTTYFAMFLSELFADEDDLGWLIPLGEPIEVDYAENWANLVMKTLSILKLRRSEEVVQGLYKKTSGANRLPIQDSWVVGETLDSIVGKMSVVLRDISVSDEESLSNILKENSWDIREELMLRGLTEAICVVSWTGVGEEGQWDEKKLARFFNTSNFGTSELLHLIWPQAKDFIKRQGISKAQSDSLWDVLHANLTLPKDKLLK